MNNDLSELSERELEVLKLVATGATNAQIARDLVISANTVKVHLRNIFEKLGVQSRTEATMEAVRRGLVYVAGATVAEGETAPAVPEAATEPAALAPEPELLAPPEPPIAGWQRAYMGLAALLVLAALFVPQWLQAHADAVRTSPFTDVGQPQTAAPARPDGITRWNVRAPLTTGTSRLALAAAGGRLYAIGGETASGPTASLTVYDPAANDWQIGPDRPIAAANVAAAVVGGKIYVPGGTLANGQASSELDVYDPQALSWRTAAALPAPRAAYALAVLNDKIYLFGGWDGTTYRGETFVYDPQADQWSGGTPMPAARAFLAASPLGNAIYVVGGYDGKRELDTVAVYDPQGEQTPAGPWSTRTPLSQPRAGLGLLTFGNRLYAIGGGWTHRLEFNEQYDTVSAAWSRIETPVVGQWRNVGAAALGDEVYAVGGYSGTYLTGNDQYTAVFRVRVPMSINPGK